MADRLTELLNKHHDKLNQHTTQIKEIQSEVAALKEQVSSLEDKLTDDNSGARMALTEWLSRLNELL